MPQRRIDLQNWSGAQEAVVQTRRLQVGGNGLDGLDCLSKLHFRLLVSAEPHQNLAKGCLPQPHLAGRLELLSQLDRGRQRLHRLRKSPARSNWW